MRRPVVGDLEGHSAAADAPRGCRWCPASPGCRRPAADRWGRWSDVRAANRSPTPRRAPRVLGGVAGLVGRARPRPGSDRRPGRGSPRPRHAPLAAVVPAAISSPSTLSAYVVAGSVTSSTVLRRLPGGARRDLEAADDRRVGVDVDRDGGGLALVAGLVGGDDLVVALPGVGRPGVVLGAGRCRAPVRRPAPRPARRRRRSPSPPRTSCPRPPPAAGPPRRPRRPAPRARGSSAPRCPAAASAPRSASARPWHPGGLAGWFARGGDGSRGGERIRGRAPEEHPDEQDR